MIGKKLRELRKERGWTQEELGERLHIHRSTVSYWETGFTDPPLEMSGRWPCCTASPLIICWGCHRGKGKKALKPRHCRFWRNRMVLFHSGCQAAKNPVFLKKRLAFSNWLM